MKLIVTQDPSDQLIENIQKNLQSFNKPFLGHVEHHRLVVYVNGDIDELKGGIVADVRGRWLLIKYFWVDEHERKSGLGTKILQKIESEAVQLGATDALLDTFSFQAKGFYEKSGYQVQMALENFPLESQVFYMTKKLS